MAKIIDIANFANDAYEIESKLNLPSIDFEKLDVKYDGSNGFQGSAYFNSKTNELVVAYAGTDFTSIKDLKADLGIGLQVAIGQTNNAKNFLSDAFNKASKIDGVNSNNINVTITGHSLGGYLVQQVMNTHSNIEGINSENIAGVVFNSPGISSDKSLPNLFSISDANDPVTGIGGGIITNNHITLGNTSGPLAAHSMDNMINTLEERPSISNFDVKEINNLETDIKSVVFKDSENSIVYITEKKAEFYKKLIENNPELAKKLDIEYNNQKAVNAIKDFNNGSQDFGEVIKWVSISPKAISDFKSILEAKGNDNLLKYLENPQEFSQASLDIKKVIVLETQEGNQLSTQLGTSIGGSIGSVIISNSDYSNIEKLAISTSTTVIGQNVGEYLFWDKNNVDGSGAFDDIGADFKNTLQGAVVSFALSSYFAKNDNISDILGMDGTFVGGLADYAVSYSLGYYGSQAISDLFSSSVSSSSSSTIGSTAGASGSALDAFYLGLSSAVAGYLGNTFANEIMDWDTKEESTGASIGSAVGAIVGTYILPVIGTFIGSFIGNIIGGIIGGLFGGSKPPPPTANAEYEFDEENLSYNLISGSSSDGGNKKAMINIGKALANHLENIFNLPGGQLVNNEFLPNIKVNQVKDTVTINGEKGTFDTVSDMLGNILIQNIPFINVENGNEYILRALNRTNEEFLKTDIHSTNRANLEEYNFINQISVNNTNYKNNKIFKKIS